MSNSDQAHRGTAASVTAPAQLPQADAILPRILTIRNQRVIVDAELAALYEVPTKRLNEAVKRATWRGFRRTSCSRSAPRSSPS